MKKCFQVKKVILKTRDENCEHNPLLLSVSKTKQKKENIRNKKIKEGKREAGSDSTGGPAAASHQWAVAASMYDICVFINLYIRVKSVCVSVCVHWAKVKLTRIPANCFSSILQDLVGKDPLPLCCRLSASAASLSLWDGLVWLSQSEFEVFWGGVRSSVSVPLVFASVAGVASLLCVNSALIQKLFYAVKRTCDRQRGVEGGEEWGRGRQGNTF